MAAWWKEALVLVDQSCGGVALASLVLVVFCFVVNFDECQRMSMNVSHFKLGLGMRPGRVELTELRCGSRLCSCSFASYLHKSTHASMCWSRAAAGLEDDGPPQMRNLACLDPSTRVCCIELVVPWRASVWLSPPAVLQATEELRQAANGWENHMHIPAHRQTARQRG